MWPYLAELGDNLGYGRLASGRHLAELGENLGYGRLAGGHHVAECEGGNSDVQCPLELLWACACQYDFEGIRCGFNNSLYDFDIIPT